MGSRPEQLEGDEVVAVILERMDTIALEEPSVGLKRSQAMASMEAAGWNRLVVVLSEQHITEEEGSCNASAVVGEDGDDAVAAVDAIT